MRFRVRGRLAALLVMSAMIAVAACGSRSELFEASTADAGVVSDDDGEAPIESGSDAPIADARAFDATARDAAETNDATIDSDGAADASDGAIDDSGLDASDGAIEDSGSDASDGAIDDSGSDAPVDACAARALYVDAVNGHDSSDGSSPATPFKTITKAIAIAAADACVTTIAVSPGTYDESNGEVFPLRVPPNVMLLGDETNKGAVVGNPTFIHGAGPATAFLSAALYPSSGATIAGFEITAPDPIADANALRPVEILLYSPMNDITVRNDTLLGSSSQPLVGSVGIYTLGSLRNVIDDNVVMGNEVGIYNGGGASSRVESNALTQNRFGFEADVLGADLGGGDGGSAGLNVLSCNFQNMWLTASGQPAANNYWDHVPPTLVSDGGAGDIFLSPFFTLTPPTTTGAMLATPNCP